MKEVKDAELHIRVTEEEKKLFSEMAKKEGISLSRYILKAVYKEISKEEAIRQLRAGKNPFGDKLKGGD